jgi:hypothetical protein
MGPDRPRRTRRDLTLYEMNRKIGAPAATRTRDPRLRRRVVGHEWRRTHSGNSISTIRPPSAAFIARTFPACALTARAVMARPRHAPDGLASSAAETRRNGRKISVSIASGTPVPRSRTGRTARDPEDPSRRWSDTSTEVPSRVWPTAFRTTFSTALRRSSSTQVSRALS